MKFYQISIIRFGFFTGFCYILTMISNVEPDLNRMYFTVEKFHVFSGNVLESFTVLDSFECLVCCMKNKRCVSVNFAVNSGSSQRFVCQLLAYGGDDGKGKTMLQHSSEYHNYYKNPCADNPCRNAGTCDVTSKIDFNCTCIAPYTGITCEQVSWVKVNTDPLCFGAKNNSFATFFMTSSGRVVLIKLVHISGTVTCKKDEPSRSTYWGCYSPSTNISKITTIITDKENNKLLPPYSNNLQGYHGNSTFIVFNMTSSSDFIEVTAGQEFRIWYYEDYADINGSGMEIDNDGLTCADVYVFYKP